MKAYFRICRCRILQRTECLLDSKSFYWCTKKQSQDVHCTTTTNLLIWYLRKISLRILDLSPPSVQWLLQSDPPEVRCGDQVRDGTFPFRQRGLLYVRGPGRPLLVRILHVPSILEESGQNAGRLPKVRYKLLDIFLLTSTKLLDNLNFFPCQLTYLSVKYLQKKNSEIESQAARIHTTLAMHCCGSRSLLVTLSKRNFFEGKIYPELFGRKAVQL